MLDSRYLAGTSESSQLKQHDLSMMAQIGLQLAAILLPHLLKCRDHRHVLPHPTNLLLIPGSLCSKALEDTAGTAGTIWAPLPKVPGATESIHLGEKLKLVQNPADDTAEHGVRYALLVSQQTSECESG